MPSLDIAKCLLRFRDELGDLWDNLGYMNIILQKSMKLNLKVLVCIMILVEVLSSIRALHIDFRQSCGYDTFHVLLEWAHPIEYPLQ